MAGNGDRPDHPVVRPNFFHVAVGSVFVAVSIPLHIQFNPELNLPALVGLGFFNFLFLFLLFPLEGALRRKVVLLMAGNCVGALWYLILLSFEDAVFVLNADTFKMAFLVAKPLVDFVWIVSVWSLSLSVLASHRRRVRLEKG